MGFGHSHSKKRLIRRVRSANKKAQHDLAHLENKDHHDAPGHAWQPGVHHHSDKPGAQSKFHAPPAGRNWPPFPALPSSHHPHPEHSEGYPWKPVEHPDYGDAGSVPPGHPHPQAFDPATHQGAWAKYREAELGTKGLNSDSKPHPRSRIAPSQPSPAANSRISPASTPSANRIIWRT
jgi:hypothetical protein